MGSQETANSGLLYHIFLSLFVGPLAMQPFQVMTAQLNKSKKNENDIRERLSQAEVGSLSLSFP